MSRRVKEDDRIVSGCQDTAVRIEVQAVREGVRRSLFSSRLTRSKIPESGNTAHGHTPALRTESHGTPTLRVIFQSRENDLHAEACTSADVPEAHFAVATPGGQCSAVLAE